MMQTEAPAKKPGGRLSREDQRRLGDILQRVYDDVLRQGVPDRFKNLLDELEVSARDENVAGNTMKPAEARNDGEPDRLLHGRENGRRNEGSN
jgi:hypothetical protein